VIGRRAEGSGGRGRCRGVEGAGGKKGRKGMTMGMH